MCVLMFKSSHGPDGKIADALASTRTCTQVVRTSETCNYPIAPMGKLLTRSLRLACTTAADALVNYSAMITDV